jgi:hypothetical protein
LIHAMHNCICNRTRFEYLLVFQRTHGGGRSCGSIVASSAACLCAWQSLNW